MQNDLSRSLSAQDPVVIVSAVRTPLGRFQGDLAALPATALGARAIAAAVERAGLPPAGIDEVLMGCVLPAGQRGRRRPGKRPAARDCPMRRAPRRSTRSAGPA